ncbi:DUF362 domain-containing protein, partial [candidate division KSB1 bacterium]
MKRRELLQGMALAGVWAASDRPVRADGPPERGGPYTGMGRVVQVHHPGATDESYRVNSPVVAEMIEAGLRELTGEPTSEEAWSLILPGYKPGAGIGIKVNAINRLVPTNPSLVEAAAGSVARSGVRPRDIIIWDRYTKSLRRAHYSVNLHEDKVRCFGTDEPGVGHDGSDRARILGHELKLSRILTTLTGHLINAPVLKDHGATGFTFALKNHYGTIPLRDGIPFSLGAIMRMHGNGGDPQIAELNAASTIRLKTRLILGDALIGIVSGGPGGAPQWRPNSIILSRDPVAADSVALDLLDRRRSETGLEEIRPRVQWL